MKEKGKKMITIDEMYPIFAKVKLAKNQGGIHDFVEILKLYDKNEDGTILGNELFRLLTNLGEKLTKEEAKGLMKELCEPEDDEGFMPFMPFLERMCSNEGYTCTSTKIYNQRVTAHFWTEFAINENLILLYSAAHQMRVRLSTHLNLNRRKKCFFVIWGKDLTHHRLHNHITKNILKTFIA